MTGQRVSGAGVAFWVAILALAVSAATAAIPLPFSLAYLLLPAAVVGLLYVTRPRP